MTAPPRLTFGPLADRLNALLHDVEDYFANAYPGVYVDVVINDTPYGMDRDGIYCWQEKKVRLSQASIELRCKFVASIVGFEDVLRANRDERYARLEQSVRDVESFLVSRAWQPTTPPPDPAGPRG